MIDLIPNELTRLQGSIAEAPQGRNAEGPR